jgi:hypothetical protein
VAAPRPEPAFFVGAFRAVAFDADRGAVARFLEVLLADDFFADARFVAFDADDLA